jgi:competence protein ComEA
MGLRVPSGAPQGLAELVSGSGHRTTSLAPAGIPVEEHHGKDSRPAVVGCTAATKGTLRAQSGRGAATPVRGSLTSVRMPSARSRSAAAPQPDRLSRLLATASERSGPGAAAADGDVWDDLLEDVGPSHEGGGGEPDLLTEGHRGRHRPGAAPGVLTLPVALRGAQLSVSATAVLGLLVVLVAVVAVFGVRWWLAEQGAESRPVPPEGRPAPVAAVQGGGGPGAEGQSDLADRQGDGAGEDGAATTTEVRRLVVHVDGQVVRPGVVELAAGARVQQALDAAGGATPQADLTRINLARPVSDGERLWVPAPGEQVPALVDGGTGSGGGPQGGAGSSGPAGGGAVLVDLNVADQAALEELPGVGPATAQAILGWRDEHGRFSSVEELLEVSGIGEKTLERLRPHVTVG